MTKKLIGKVAIIIGATRGIGKGIAEVYVKEGARLVLTGRQADTLASAIKDLEPYAQTPGQIIGVTADISKAADVDKIITAALDNFGKIDILCQNAGIFPEKRIDEMSETDWDTVNDTNLKGTFLAVKACFPIMKKQQYGRMVIISSITGPRTGIPGLAHYSASKGGINGFIKSAAIEFAPYNITINAVEPGNILTEGLQALGSDYLEKMTQAIPLGRLGSPQEIGHAALFLASDEAAFITGQSLVVDGGQTLPESRLALARPAQAEMKQPSSTAASVKAFAASSLSAPAEKKEKPPASLKGTTSDSARRRKLVLGATFAGLLGAVFLLKFAPQKNGSSDKPAMASAKTLKM